jgi:hypothetical protein
MIHTVLITDEQFIEQRTALDSKFAGIFGEWIITPPNQDFVPMPLI